MSLLNTEAPVSISLTDTIGIEDRIDAVVASWSKDKAKQGLIGNLLGRDGRSGMFRGVSVMRNDTTDTYRVEVTARKHAYGMVGVQVAPSIPLEWFDRSFIEVLNTQIDWVLKPLEKDMPYIPDAMYAKSSARFLLKMIALGSSLEGRKDWTTLMRTLRNYPDFRIYSTNMGVVQMPITGEHAHPIKVDYAMKGFRNMAMADNLYAIGADKGYFMFEEPKKAVSRIGSLVSHPDTLDMGEHSFFLPMDIEDDRLKEMLMTGTGYVPKSLFGRIGTVRAISDCGSLKMTTMYHPNSWEDELGGRTLISAASFKGGKRGLFNLVSDNTDSEYLLDVSQKEVEEILASKVETITLDGCVVHGWNISMHIKVTNLYSFYGLSRVQDDLIMEDFMDEGSSYYLEVWNLLKEDPYYNALQDRYDRQEAGEIRVVNKGINIKMQEIQNAYWSYGPDIANEFINDVVRTGYSRCKPSVRYAWDLQAGVDMEFTDISEEEMRIYANILLHPRDMKRVVPGRLDPKSWINSELGETCIKGLLEGFEALGNTNFPKWDGLLGASNKRITLGGKAFLIPGGDVMSEHQHSPEGTDTVFVNGPIKAFMMLLLALRNPNNDWSLTHIAYQNDMQCELLGKKMDNINVRGFANKVMLPAPWLKRDELLFTDPDFAFMRNKEITGSKMPVLFNKAETGFIARTKLPVMFQDADPILALGLNAAIFCSIDIMMDHQNDTDGDQFRVAAVSGLPLYDGLDDHMLAWSKPYIEGERDLRLKYKSYAFISHHAVSDAVEESVTNKIQIGIGSNGLFMLSHLLQMFQNDTVLSWECSRRLRDYYACGFHNSVVRGLKHEGYGDLFKSASMYQIMYGRRHTIGNESISPMAAARLAFINLIDREGHSDAEVNNTVLALFGAFDDFSMSTWKDGRSPLADRRARSIETLSYDEVAGEFLMKEFDMLSGGYVHSHYAAQPRFADKLDNPTSFDVCMYNIEEYYGKYILIGQALPDHSDTIIGVFLQRWRSFGDRRISLARKLAEKHSMSVVRADQIVGDKQSNLSEAEQEVLAQTVFLEPLVHLEDSPVNLNTATVLELASGLHSIGSTKAKAIVAHRAHHGAFTDIKELLNVKGIGQYVYDLNLGLIVI